MAELLQMRKVRAGYGETVVLEDVDLALPERGALAVLGRNGVGKTTTLRSIMGLTPPRQGQIVYKGQNITGRPAYRVAKLGIGFVPEDRKSQGIFLGQSLRTNVSVSSLDRFSKMGILNHRGIARLAKKMVENLDLHTTGIDQRAGNLSGGNQQKTVIARWLSINPRVLILDEPTRGVDVGAKAEIYALMSDLARQGVGILMISSELPEVLGVSDRILVMREGRIVAEFDRERASQDAIMKAATGQDNIERSPEATSV